MMISSSGLLLGWSSLKSLLSNVQVRVSPAARLVTVTYPCRKGAIPGSVGSGPSLPSDASLPRALRLLLTVLKVGANVVHNDGPTLPTLPLSVLSQLTVCVHHNE